MDHKNGLDLVAFDMDGVLVDYDSSWTWVHRHFNVDNEVSLAAYIDGEIDDMEFMRRDISLWLKKKNDLCMADIDSILRPVPIISGIKDTIDDLHSHGIRCVIISGGLDMTASRIAEEFGFDDFMANSLECDAQGRLTGEGVLRVELSNKRRALETYQQRFDASKERTACIGNSFVDVSMFRGGGFSIAFNPIDDLVRKNADLVLCSKDLRVVVPPLLER